MSIENLEQIIASDPAHSVWVSASAGTGKTKVLTDRVLRLLIEGVEFEKILCLTFTNAAASEMTNRISNALFEWQQNTNNLESILGRNPTNLERASAQGLFERLMLSSRQLSIHTIHSFCQKILQSFPFEAGLQPGFKVIDNIDSSELISKVVKDIGSRNDDASFKYLLQNLHENTFLEMIEEILADQIYFQELFRQFETSDKYKAFLTHKMEAHETEEALLEMVKSSLQRVKSIYRDYEPFLSMTSMQEEDFFTKLQFFFLTAKGEPKKKLLTKKESDANPSLEKSLREMQDLVYQTDQKVNVLHMISATAHVFEVAKYVIEKYNFYKKRKGYLDYDDLIYHTKELLTNSEMRDWVLYKLDGGVRHLLIDEAQDTSPEQWQIIEAIMREFYSGSTSSDDNRTIFIVGDEKQSIYSFQGADVGNFNRFNDYIRKQMQDASKSYKDVNLKWSYRSSRAILEFVEVVRGVKSDEAIIHDDDRVLRPFRDSVGSVEIWPLYHDTKSQKDLFWPLIDEMQSEENASKLLAKDIAKYIRNYIESGRIMHSTGKPASAEDFMILVRRRNDFMAEVIEALKGGGVEVGGADRIVLTDHISIKDILSLAKYALMPKDELNLAALLKSPIIGMSEEELLKWCGADDSSLLLNHITSLATLSTAAEFFYQVIEVMNLRQILLDCNGPSSNDVLDELLGLVMQFERKHSTSLQEFIFWIERNDMEVKRDTSATGSVRVMTIHGAKGLEAPIIILADTTSLPTRQNHILWGDGMCLWLGGSGNANIRYSEIKKSLELLDYQEYLRILYVALTRAEDHLVIAGYSSRENIQDECFYDVANRAMKKLGHIEENGVKYFGEVTKVALNKREGTFAPIKRHCEASKMPWQSQPIQREIALSAAFPYNEVFWQKIAASTSTPRNDNVDSLQNSPLNSRTSLSYGQLLHKILEDSVNTHNFTFSPSHPMIQSLDLHLRDEIIKKLSQVFAMEEFAKLIKNTKIYTEVPIGYNDAGIMKVGRIDLLSVSEGLITILDYKTDKRVPACREEVSESYIQQLRFYTGAMRKIYPEHQIKTKILWLEDVKMMEC